MSNAGRELIRRPSTVIASSVASSAQCTSSSTSTVGCGGSSSSAIRSEWMSCGAAPAESASSSGVETLPTRSRIGPSGRGIDEIVTAAAQHPSAVAQISQEPGHERRLPDPRLSGDEDDAAPAACRRVPRLGERRQCPIALEELHGSNDRPGSAPRHSAGRPLQPRFESGGAVESAVRTLELLVCPARSAWRRAIDTAATRIPLYSRLHPVLTDVLRSSARALTSRESHRTAALGGLLRSFGFGRMSHFVEVLSALVWLSQCSR